MSITISVTFLSTLCNQNTGTVVNKFEKFDITIKSERLKVAREEILKDPKFF